LHNCVCNTVYSSNTQDFHVSYFAHTLPDLYSLHRCRLQGREEGAKEEPPDLVTATTLSGGSRISVRGMRRGSRGRVPGGDSGGEALRKAEHFL